MNRTPRGQLLVTTPAAKRYEVPLRDGSTWTGTRRELAETYPEWLGQAKEVQATPEAIELDYSDDPRPGRLPSSSRRYYMPDVAQRRMNIEMRPGIVQTKIPPRRSATVTEDIPQARPKRQRRGLLAHPLLYLGIGMLAMLALWVLLQMAVSWWTMHTNDVTYGRPRTYQFDAVFGHNDSASTPTHIIIVNLNRHVIVIELPGGDATHSRIYSGPILFGDGQDLTPVTGRAVDANSDGKLDLVLSIGDQRIVYLNDGTQFVPLKPGQQVNIPK